MINWKANAYFELLLLPEHGHFAIIAAFKIEFHNVDMVRNRRPEFVIHGYCGLVNRCNEKPAFTSLKYVKRKTDFKPGVFVCLNFSATLICCPYWMLCKHTMLQIHSRGLKKFTTCRQNHGDARRLAYLTRIF